MYICLYISMYIYNYTLRHVNCTNLMYILIKLYIGIYTANTPIKI